ncbi:DUF4269 domain-containing protein [Flavobacterium foetidum]|uniref:DUF4269 domain-containing protein n=1 Tax=Flavobacterium foetidum TaxID=2026681 RepID=UPI001074A028|nr:DUF4269 domain-containing protein [Flavobacterium foetidum]KAF2514253.1 DUF4269 domain-containing protein [Flavobacterium foetidum]
MTDFTKIAYLKNGNLKQKRAFEVLTHYKVLENLAEFDALITGTIPINIDIDGSDLDIICYWKNKTYFIEKVKLLFQKYNGFWIKENIINAQESVVASFRLDEFEIEIFGQNIPTQNQNAYKHMVVEAKILRSKGENFRVEIIKLKQNGHKTEPAFALLLGLKGNPYEELLSYEV